MALVLDLMASLIGDGDSTKEISERKQETGVSQVFMAIDIISQMGAADTNEKVNAIIEDFLDIHSLKGGPMVRYPGQGMVAERRKNLKEGIPVETELWQMIKNIY